MARSLHHHHKHASPVSHFVRCLAQHSLSPLPLARRPHNQKQPDQTSCLHGSTSGPCFFSSCSTALPETQPASHPASQPSSYGSDRPHQPILDETRRARKLLCAPAAFPNTSHAPTHARHLGVRPCYFCFFCFFFVFFCSSPAKGVPNTHSTYLPTYSAGSGASTSRRCRCVVVVDDDDDDDALTS
ncbi:uncharacterized protein K452DRAFT_6882 [Aplosporella prunicola CBS 121167]|uniref:Uncharacterized protein n=1 Tax=Aplosporella prunicola CBS 121167 TaxID=1176127 RepID=A0A6A6BU94_9PEZI|nr:uncharacterized protein K452DRAFT_6882 [Aplosporella prunicola CBS 121167]KAF2147398.1 hypothetical protein K452DRAFT_6882 [Aplosporella prunicola CBS 121167]